MTQDEEEVRATLAAFEAAMGAMDFGAVRRLWDAAHPHLRYQPEEHAGPCTSWAEVEAYWDHVPDVVSAITEWRHHDTDVAVVGDVAVVFTEVSTSFDLVGLDEPFAGESRFTFALQRSDDGWRLFHAHESRQLVVE